MPNPFHALRIPTTIATPTNSEGSTGVDRPQERVSKSTVASTSQALHTSTLSMPSEML